MIDKIKSLFEKEKNPFKFLDSKETRILIQWIVREDTNLDHLFSGRKGIDSTELAMDYLSEQSISFFEDNQDLFEVEFNKSANSTSPNTSIELKNLLLLLNERKPILSNSSMIHWITNNKVKWLQIDIAKAFLHINGAKVNPIIQKLAKEQKLLPIQINNLVAEELIDHLNLIREFDFDDEVLTDKLVREHYETSFYNLLNKLYQKNLVQQINDIIEHFSDAKHASLLIKDVLKFDEFSKLNKDLSFYKLLDDPSINFIDKDLTIEQVQIIIQYIEKANTQLLMTDPRINGLLSHLRKKYSENLTNLSPEIAEIVFEKGETLESALNKTDRTTLLELRERISKMSKK
jgi:Predicted ATP-utilizing enzyme (ATP-grasp superfamily)